MDVSYVGHAVFPDAISMKIHNLHPWDVSPKEAVKLQEALHPLLKISPWEAGGISTVAGADISYDKKKNVVYAGVVILSFPDLRLIAEVTHQQKAHFPYVPGLLSFREAPALLKVFAEIKESPQIAFFDGQGIAHPRSIGLASHLGLFLDIPTIGCAKTKLVGNFSEAGNTKGDFTYLTYKGKKVGAVLRTRDGVKPIFVSPGHKIDVDTALRLTLACTTRYRLPEPTRLAHLLATRMRRRFAGGMENGRVRR